MAYRTDIRLCGSVDAHVRITETVNGNLFFDIAALGEAAEMGPVTLCFNILEPDLVAGLSARSGNDAGANLYSRAHSQGHMQDPMLHGPVLNDMGVFDVAVCLSAGQTRFTLMHDLIPLAVRALKIDSLCLRDNSVRRTGKSRANSLWQADGEVVQGNFQRKAG